MPSVVPRGLNYIGLDVPASTNGVAKGGTFNNKLSMDLDYSKKKSNKAETEVDKETSNSKYIS